MKKNLTKEIIVFIFFSFLLITSIHCSPFTIISITDNNIILDFNLPQYEIKNSELEGYQKIICPSASYTSEEGLPSLPIFSEIIGIPVDGKINVSISNTQTSQIANILIEPNETIELRYKENIQLQQDTLPEIEYILQANTDFYNSNTLYPVFPIKTNESAFAGNNKIQSFVFHPFQVNSQNRTLQIINSARINISISGTTNKTRNSFYEDRYSLFLNDLLLNYDKAKLWQRENTSKVKNYEPKYKGLNDISILNIVIIEDGIYKISYEELKEQMQVMQDSLNINFLWDIDQLNPKYLELKNNGMPVPIHFVGENDQSFDPGDYLEFWGEHNKGEEAYYHSYTNKNIYKLFLLNDTVGTRMAVENGGLNETNSSNIIIPDGYEQTVHFENQVFTDRLGNQVAQGNTFFHKEDVLFWKAITAPDLNISPFELEYPLNVNTRYFNAKVSVWGASHLSSSNDYDHHAIVRINSALVNNQSWRDQTEQIFENHSNMANSYLINGTNNMFIDMPGDTPMGYLEQIFLDYFEITYWREYRTDKNFLKFKKPSNRPFGLYQFELHNFTQEDVSIYKIGSSVFNNITIEPLTELGIPPYTIKFQDYINSNEIEYIALTDNQKLTPFAYSYDIPSDLLNPDNQADYLILTNTQFVNSEGALFLQQTWQTNGINTKLIDVQDIYDEFNNGQISPKAIKNFFSYAYNNWTEPRFSHVLLLGDGIFDKKHQADIDKYDIIPIYNIWTNKYGATASDNWYACIIGDDPIPDFHISRISVTEEEHILSIAEKTHHYINNPDFHSKWHSQVTLASGGKISDYTDTFAQQNENIRTNYIPDYYQVNRVYTAVSTVSPQYTGGTFQLKDKINDGTVFLQFMGHGGGRIWSDYNLLNANDVKTLSNTNYPFVSSLACFASAFDTRGLASIGEVFVAEPGKGAIAHIGFSGLGYLRQDEDFGNYLADGFFNKNLKSFGEISTYTKAKFFGQYGNSYAGIALTQGCVLLGDPMIGHHRIIQNGEISIDNDNYLVNPGDTLTINANFTPDVYSAKMYILNENEIAQNIVYESPAIQGIFQNQYTIPNDLGSGKRDIKIIASGTNQVYSVNSKFAIGNSIFTESNVIPDIPTENDSIQITTKLFTNKNIHKLTLTTITNYTENTYDMLWDNIAEQYISHRIKPFAAGQIINYHFKIYWADDSAITNSETYSFKISAPDLVILNMLLTENNGEPGYNIQIQNSGDVISQPTNLSLKSGTKELNQIEVNPINIMDNIWLFVSIPQTIQHLTINAIVNNNGENFGEYSYTNNSMSHQLDNYFFKAGLNPFSIYSLDKNLKIDIPENIFQQDVWFSIEKSPSLNPDNQPDIQTLKLINNDFSPAYNISLLDNSGLIDTLGTLPNNKRIILSFFYHKTDSDVLEQETENNFTVFRWDAYTSKWIQQGGSYIDTVNKKVICDVTKTGTYTVLRNYDTTVPLIDVNVEGQEFTVGGYISGKGVLSFLFSDANGIDILEHPIEMYINGQLINPQDFAMSIIPGHTNHIPMKYHLSHPKGDYTIIISCSDVNGNHNSRQFSFKINDRFDLIRTANYPNPVRSRTIDPVNAGRTRFTYTLTDDADTVTLKVYTVSGRLVKTFRNLPTSVGYHEYPRTVYSWDCRDEEGYELANGMYFYKIIANKGNKEIIKTNKLSILK